MNHTESEAVAEPVRRGNLVPYVGMGLFGRGEQPGGLFTDSQPADEESFDMYVLRHRHHGCGFCG